MNDFTFDTGIPNPQNNENKAAPSSLLDVAPVTETKNIPAGFADGSTVKLWAVAVITRKIEGNVIEHRPEMITVTHPDPQEALRLLVEGLKEQRPGWDIVSFNYREITTQEMINILQGKGIISPNMPQSMQSPVIDGSTNSSDETQQVNRDSIGDIIAFNAETDSNSNQT